MHVARHQEAAGEPEPKLAGQLRDVAARELEEEAADAIVEGRGAGIREVIHQSHVEECGIIADGTLLRWVGQEGGFHGRDDWWW